MTNTTAPRVDNVRYLVRSQLNAKLVLCTNGEFIHEDYIGPGTNYAARLYKTQRGALAVRNGQVLVSKCDRFGVEVSS